MATSSPAPSHLSAQKEELRLAALQSLDLLDTPESDSFDRITRLASFFFGTPISAMSLTDRSRQWFKSYHGVENREIPREGAPCAEVTESQQVLHIPNLLDHKRYQNCGLAQAGIRFYAGAPLTTRQGHTLGAFCVLDSKPRELSQEQLSQLQDMAAMVMSQVELQHEFGRVDPVSGLPNRYQLAADLEDVARLQHQTSRVLLLIEIADLRHVNESVSVLGSTYLEELLRVCAVRIRAALRKGSVLFHVGFAAFAVVLDDARDLWQEVIDIISDALRTPIEIGGGVVSVTAGYGVAPFDARTTIATDALRMATSAVHEARQNDLQFAVYNESSHAAHQRRFTILRCLRESLAQEHHFHLVYQPRVDVATGLCIGAEALLRWSHPELGNISPGEFIPIIEQTNLAGPMTRWVLGNALAQLHAWKVSGQQLRISINVSARNLEELDFAQQVASALSLYGIGAHEIELEFTESALIRHEGRVHRQLEQLRQLGIELAIDDFGTGYSSFSYLQKLPAQVVKLDQSFIRNVGSDEKGILLVGAMIRMSHDLGYRVVAEGVETREVFDLLKTLQCDEIQGYFFARPLTVAALEEFLRMQSEAELAGSF